MCEGSLSELETVVKLFMKRLPTSQPPPLSPPRYVADCRRPPRWPGEVELSSRPSKAAMAPAPFNIARYPPPDIAMPMLGRADRLFSCVVMYDGPSKLGMLNLRSRSRIGLMVLASRVFNHCFSLPDKSPPSRTVGRVEGQSRCSGV